MNMSSKDLEVISSEDVQEFLEWNSLFSVIELALIDLSQKDKVVAPPRLFMEIPDKQGVLLNMPGYSKTANSMGCKLVTSFPNNARLGIPSIFAKILLMDPETGITKAIVDGQQITGWRTAAVSAIATKHMKKGIKNILTIIGAGVQAETHALAFNHLFEFKEIRIWNRTKGNADLLASKLPFPVKVYESLEESCKDADVICTTTYAHQPYLKLNWLKNGVHINAVGAASNHYSELEEEIYKNAYITVEQLESANNELKGLLERGIEIKCEIGKFILNGSELPQGTKCSIFQSLGSAVEDITTATLVYNKYKEKKMLSRHECK